MNKAYSVSSEQPGVTTDRTHEPSYKIKLMIKARWLLVPLISAFIISTGLVAGIPFPWAVLIIMLAEINLNAIYNVLVWHIKRPMALSIFSSIQYLIDVVALTGCIMVTEGIRSPFQILYVVVVLASCVQWGLDKAIWTATASVLGLVFIASYDFFVLKVQATGGIWLSIFIQILLYYTVGVWGGYLSEKLSKIREKTTQDRIRMEIEKRESQRLVDIGRAANLLFHDARSYLTCIKNECEMKRRKVKEQKYEGIDESLSIILKQAEATSHLLSQVLDLAKPIQLKMEELELVNFTQECVENHSNELEMSGCNLVKDLPDESVKVFADSSHLSRVFDNIIKNALEAMEGRPEHKLTVKLTTNGTIAQLEFIDTGCGIPKEDMEKLFVPFQTGSNKKGGTGLGLTIVREIIRKHRGEVTLNSELGRGTTVTVVIPAITKS